MRGGVQLTTSLPCERPKQCTRVAKSGVLKWTIARRDRVIADVRCTGGRVLTHSCQSSPNSALVRKRSASIFRHTSSLIWMTSWSRPIPRSISLMV